LVEHLKDQPDRPWTESKPGKASPSAGWRINFVPMASIPGPCGSVDEVAKGYLKEDLNSLSNATSPSPTSRN
jgi:hypothetical protein